MKYAFLLLAVSAISLVSLSQDKVYTDADAERRNVGAFTAIKVSSGIDLYLSQSNQPAVAVSAAKKEYRDKIRTVIENGILKIWYDNDNGWSWWSWGNRKLKAYISVQNLESLKASGGSDVFINGTLSVSKLYIGVSGGSDFKGKVNVNDLQIGCSGGSDVTISGRAANLSVDASGGSDVRAYELASDNCKVASSGGSDIYVTVNKELDARASGGSDVHYKGNAVIRHTNSSGGSSVSKRS